MNYDCKAEPKIMITLEDQQKHIPNNCTLIEFERIIEDKSFINDLLEINVEQHMDWANDSLNKIYELFKDGFEEFKSNILK